MGKVQEVINKYETAGQVQLTLEQLESQLLGTDHAWNETQHCQMSVSSLSNGLSYMNVSPKISNNDFVFNYQQPMYSFTPISEYGISSPVMSTTPTQPTSPISDTNPNKRQERLEKYRQKRGKRNWNRPVDQARRERAQHRVRDEFGHFVSSKSSPNSSKSSPLRSDDNSPQDDLLYGTVPIQDLFNTLNPNATYVDAFKEKIDFGLIDLNWTESRFNFKDLSLIEDPVDLAGSFS
jgi:hypothetical protein